MKSVDIVIPAYNEEECIDELCRRLALVFDGNPAYSWRAIIVENGSSDLTWLKARRVAELDSRFAVVRLSRNFHMDGGLTAGLELATADALVFMTADLQDPPEVIPLFVAKWEEGFQNVYGEVVKREGTGPIRRFNSWAFYKLATAMTSGRLPRNASDFRLMDRRLYEVVRQMSEANRFMRGLVAWAGFESASIPVPRPPRFAGESKAYSLPVIGLAFRALFAHSYLPLRVITFVGFIVAFLASITFVALAIAWVTTGVPFAGFGTVVSLILFLFGTTALMLGIIAEYISLIYEEVKHRPNFVIAEIFGLTPR